MSDNQKLLKASDLKQGHVYCMRDGFECNVYHDLTLSSLQGRPKFFVHTNTWFMVLDSSPVKVNDNIYIKIIGVEEEFMGWALFICYSRQFEEMKAPDDDTTEAA